jgi:predicted TIM-barrel fold metal-dependent hydrolase
MILDGHIHIGRGKRDRAELIRRLQAAGVDGGVLISLPPDTFAEGTPLTAQERLDDLFFWCEAGPNLYPFYWIDPLAEDAIEQVTMAVERGVAGFKVICDRHYPGHERAIETFKAIAQTDRPLLFHSGILWDGKPSAQYNRPGGFEALLEVDGLRFSLAHISWPWCDELIAVYGKFLNAYTRRPDLSVEMFIDTTPGTPPIYRREALIKLFTVGYDVVHNVIFGSDSNANEYNVAWTREWICRDQEILEQLGLEPETLDGIFAENLKRFLGLSSSAPIQKKVPRPAE